MVVREIELLEGEKVSGELIRARDWNQLVAAVRALDTQLDSLTRSVDQRFQALSGSVDERFASLSTSVDGRFGEVTTRLDALEAFQTEADGRLDQLEHDVAALVTRANAVDTTVAGVQTGLTTLQTVVSPLVAFYNYKLTLSSTRDTFALGELAQITALVTNLAGQPLAERPWIDFVTPWGQLQPASGFESIGGVGDRTVSVRANSAGIARVLLHAEHVQGINDAVISSAVATSMSTRMATSSQTVAEAIVESATPMQAKQSGAFRTLSAEYDRTDATGVRSYLDAYYLDKAPTFTDARVVPNFSHSWRDYRTTVIAFAKADADPLTPDASHGVGSIQVTFRDWVGSWLQLEYGEELVTEVEQAREHLGRRVTDDLAESAEGLQVGIDELVPKDHGVIGRQRDYEVVRRALDDLDLPQPPPFLSDLKRSVSEAVTMQQAMEVSQATALHAPSQNVTVRAFTQSYVRADAAATVARQEVQAARTETNQAIATARVELQQSINSSVGTLTQQVGSLGGRLDATLAEGGDLRRLQSTVSSLSGKVDAMRDLDPSNVQAKLVEFEGIKNRLEGVERVVIGR
jgi:hypothetical protein